MEARMNNSTKSKEKNMSVYDNFIKEDFVDPDVPAPFRNNLKDVDRSILEKYHVIERCYDQLGKFNLSKFQELCQSEEKSIRKELSELMKMNKEITMRQFKKWSKETGKFKEWELLASIGKEKMLLENQIKDTEDLLDTLWSTYEQKCQEESDILMKLGCLPIKSSQTEIF